MYALSTAQRSKVAKGYILDEVKGFLSAKD
jgi:hypothetical protein